MSALSMSIATIKKSISTVSTVYAVYIDRGGGVCIIYIDSDYMDVDIDGVYGVYHI